MADWDPDQYLAFAGERERPALDLIARVPLRRPRLVYDLGCGPGNSTELLLRAFPSAQVTGIDNSPAMIARARETVPLAKFNVGDVAMWRVDRSADLVFANALFQWVPDHLQILIRIAHDLKHGGVLAVQMPLTGDEPTHTLMQDIAAGDRWRGKLARASSKRDAIPGNLDYYDALRPHATDLEIWQTTYMHVAEGYEGIAAFYRATGLKPYLDRLSDAEQSEYLAMYMKRLGEFYPAAKDGKVLFGLPRLFIVLRK
jgi:trans-aconitate 2-methyltransferase